MDCVVSPPTPVPASVPAPVLAPVPVPFFKVNEEKSKRTFFSNFKLLTKVYSYCTIFPVRLTFLVSNLGQELLVA
jgi:hypothetical protein